MTDYVNLQVEHRGPVAVVTIDRPEKMNTFDAALRRELLSAARAVNEDDSVRVVVLTGAGRAFGAGADLTEQGGFGTPGWRVDDQLNHEYKPALMTITEAPKPWISAVAGAAAGVSASFAMACDLTVMADNAYIYQAFAAIGLIPDGGATWHLARTLGRKRAYEMMVCGEKVGAQKCLDLGLCNRVVPVDRLMDETLAWAAELAGRAPLSLRHTKRALNEAMEYGVGDMISREAALQHLCVGSEDAREGAAAFLEKRSPAWKGR